MLVTFLYLTVLCGMNKQVPAGFSAFRATQTLCPNHTGEGLLGFSFFISGWTGDKRGTLFPALAQGHQVNRVPLGFMTIKLSKLGKKRDGHGGKEKMTISVWGWGRQRGRGATEKKNQGRISELDLWHLHTHKTWAAQLLWAWWVGFSLFQNRLLSMSVFVGHIRSTQILTFGLVQVKAQ